MTAPLSNMTSTTQQVVVDLPEVTLAQLDAIAQAKGLPRTAALIQAISTAYQLVVAEQSGGQVFVRKSS